MKRPLLELPRRLLESELPSGLSRASAFAFLQSLSIDGAPNSELAGYLAEDFERFVFTWAMARELTGEALEIGANPYFTTLLLEEFSDLVLELTNFFTPADPGTPITQRVSYRRPNGEPVDRELTYRPMNVESDRFPYPADSFDVVFFCEVIEHLQVDPVAALLEIGRVLRPGGRLILTTPNVARLENVARLVVGSNIYDPYSGYGPYGRHNREYNRHELHRLLTYCGFESIDSFTADVHENRADSHLPVEALAPLLSGRASDLGQYLFVSAIAGRGTPGAKRPSFLYRSFPPGVIEQFE